MVFGKVFSLPEKKDCDNFRFDNKILIQTKKYLVSKDS